MQLTDHFGLQELVDTSTGLPNNPDHAAVNNLSRLCADLLEPARALAGGPLRVTSGYRSRAVNARVGGVATSAHLEGRAADVVPTTVSPAVLFDLIRPSSLPYDQVIHERSASGAEWVHMAVAREGQEPRRQALVAKPQGGRMVYERVL